MAASTLTEVALSLAQHFLDSVAGPVLQTHAPIPLRTLGTELENLLTRLQTYHWSEHFPVQTKRIYGSGTHNLKNVVTSFHVEHVLVQPARAFAWAQFETLMDRYVSGGNGGAAVNGTWMKGLRVQEYDTDINNDQLEALVVCLLQVKADLNGVCDAVIKAGGVEWWVVPSPMSHFATNVTASGLGVFKFEDQSRHTVAIGAPPQSSGVYYPTYTTMPEHASALVDDMAELSVEENLWWGFLEEEKGYVTTADCMSAMMDDEGFFDEDRWTVVEI